MGSGRGGLPAVIPAVALVAVAPLASVVGCTCERGTEPSPSALASAPWAVTSSSPPQREGMVWIPPGVLIAGTPPGRLPRIADEELPGVRIEMRGFFIDRFNHPHEPGTIPRAHMTQAEARVVCEGRGMRLCTELEWERACKGPDNQPYAYGDEYDAEACDTGTSDALAPNGVNPRCVSGFGVHDMHGSAWNWTSSAWERGAAQPKAARRAGSRRDAPAPLVVVRGGNGADGEVIARCANGRGLRPERRHKRVGVRCCAGEANTSKVELQIERGSALGWRRPTPKVAEALAALVPDGIRTQVKDRPSADHFRVDRLWIWRPIGNEELVLGGGCAHPPDHDACGVVVARLQGDEAQPVSFVATDWWVPTLDEHDSARRLLLYGGDRVGLFRKTLEYKVGRVEEGSKYRKRQGWWQRDPSPPATPAATQPATP
jgi:formylglycine-generating enzyme required for sulfatase activity